MILKLVYLQILRNWRRSILLILNLLIGMASFVLLISVKDSVLNSVYESSKKYLGADLTLYSRQEIDPLQVQTAEESLPENFQKSSMLELYTMVKGERRSRLSLIVAVEDNYPFYGEYQLLKKGVIRSADKKAIIQKNKIWVYPELLKQLNLQVGDKLKIGKATFVIDDVVVAAAGQNSGWAAMAPIIYMSFASLEKTHLVQKGSTVWRSFLYKIPTTSDVESLVSKIDSHLEDPALKVQSHLKAGEQASRLVLYFTDFLSLAGLVVLFLSVIGVYFLFQSYLNSQTSTIAIFKSLGMIPRKIQAIYFLFFLFHSLMAFLLALLFVNSLLPFMNLFLKEVAFFDLSFKLSKVSLILSFFILLVLTVFLSWPVLKALDKVRVKSLFNDQVSVHSLLSFKKVLLHVPLFLFFGVLSVWLANSWHTGGIFWSSLILIMFITGLAWLGFCEVLTKYLLPKNLSWHFKSWLRRPVPTLLVFLAMSMSLLLINFLIYTENQLHRELLFTGANGRPSLFIFDIQEEQLTDLQLVAKQNNFKYNSIAPMIRAKLTKVNGRNFEKLKDEEVFKTRESEREQRFRNRGMNLTYREKLSSSESLISGKNYVGIYSGEGKVPISIESRFADRLNLKLNDEITFEIQGVEVEAIFSSVRNVKWTSFEPNFFIQFPLGVLEMAPKTFIATTPYLGSDQIEKFQSDLVDQVPNASIIDVSRLVERISKMVQKMAGALKLITALALICGMLIIFSINQHQMKQKTKDITLLKWLGVTQSKLLKLYIFEFSFIAFIAGCFAIVLAQLLTYTIGKFVFQSDWWGHSYIPLFNLLAISVVSMLISRFVVKNIFKTKTKVINQV